MPSKASAAYMGYKEQTFGSFVRNKNSENKHTNKFTENTTSPSELPKYVEDSL